MLKTMAKANVNGKEVEKLFVAGNVIKGEMKNNMLFITLSSYKGKDQNEYTNNIAVTDAKKIDFIKKLNKGTQLFCEINATKKEYNGKEYTNLYLFNFELGREGKGTPLFSETEAMNDDFYI